MCIETIRDIQVIRQERDEILTRKIRENFETVYFFAIILAYNQKRSPTMTYLASYHAVSISKSSKYRYFNNSLISLMGRDRFFRDETRREILTLGDEILRQIETQEKCILDKSRKLETLRYRSRQFETFKTLKISRRDKNETRFSREKVEKSRRDNSRPTPRHT